MQKQGIDLAIEDNFYRVTADTARVMVSIIDALAKRGGFQGEEMLQIGQVRETFVALTAAAENREINRTSIIEDEES